MNWTFPWDGFKVADPFITSDVPLARLIVTGVWGNLLLFAEALIVKEQLLALPGFK